MRAVLEKCHANVICALISLFRAHMKHLSHQDMHPPFMHDFSLLLRMRGARTDPLAAKCYPLQHIAGPYSNQVGTRPRAACYVVCAQVVAQKGTARPVQAA